MVPTLSGANEPVTLPPGIQSNHETVLKGEGVRDLASKKRGDLRATFKVRIPSYPSLSPDKQAAVKVLAGQNESTRVSTGPSPTAPSGNGGGSPNPSPDRPPDEGSDKGLFGRIKEKFCKDSV